MSNIRKRNSYEAWLQYKRKLDSGYSKVITDYFKVIKVDISDPIRDTVIRELTHFAKDALNITPIVNGSSMGYKKSITVTLREFADTYPDISNNTLRGKFDCRIVYSGKDGNDCVYIIGNDSASALYGVFRFIRKVMMDVEPENIDEIFISSNSMRMIQHWDNLDGSIERGYAGKSIFFKHGKVMSDSPRIADYARLLASIGINAVSINNVNVNLDAISFLSEKFIDDIVKLANTFREYGIILFISVNFASPSLLGKLPTSDPMDQSVKKWWRVTVSKIYNQIPDFGGFLVKADSESTPGPHSYGRTQDQGANTIAEALRPYGGRLIWRCFIYNNKQDWRDRKTDRAMASYNTFMELDGKFQSNVILQVKNGPMDFQVREPPSPLLCSIKKTSLNLELQLTQEYTGQQVDLFYLLPTWHEVVSFPPDGENSSPLLYQKISNLGNDQFRGGIVGVSNIGDSIHWTGNPLAQANLFAFGELAYNPGLNIKETTDEWICLTFGDSEKIRNTLLGMLLSSHTIYENYTAPLGVGWMVTPGTHYGPSVDGYEYSKWGTYHFADSKGLGVDRTKKTGSGYVEQYSRFWEYVFSNPETCPEHLLLFFHHLPYSYVLKSGKTLIQHIYDTHFDGVDQVIEMISQWETLKDTLDEETFEEVASRLDKQHMNAREWRDQINTYFFRKSGILDEKGRTIYP